MENIINSFATKNASWLSGISIFLGLAIGIFTTSMMQAECTFLTVSIFLLCVVIELGISIMNLSHGMFELTGNKYAERRSWVAIALGFIFNSALIYGAAAANVFTYSQAFLFWLIYMGANVFRIFFGFIASTMIHTTKEALQTTIAYKNQQVELSKISAIAEVEMAKQFQIVRQLELEAAKELSENQSKKLAAHEKFAATTGAVIGKIAGAKSVMSDAFSENFSAAKQRKPENLAENVRKPTENVENFDPKNKSNSVFEIVSIFVAQDDSVSIILDNGSTRKFKNSGAIKSQKYTRIRTHENKGKPNERPNPKYSIEDYLFCSFVYDNIPEKSITGNSNRNISESLIMEYIDTKFKTVLENDKTTEDEYDNSTIN